MLMCSMLVGFYYFRRASVGASGCLLHYPQLTLHADTRRRAQHGCSQCGFDREQNCQEYEQPGAKRFHEFRLAQYVFGNGGMGMNGP